MKIKKACKKVAIFPILLSSLGLLVIYDTWFFSPGPIWIIYEQHELGFLDPNVSCSIPLHHPFDPAILKYVQLAKPIVCQSSYKNYMKVDEEGYLCWNETALQEDGLSTSSYENCRYKEIWRPANDDFNFEYGKEKYFSGKKVKLNSDFVYVECNSFMHIRLYSDFLAHVQKKTNVRKYKDGEYDVLIIGLDSVSRLNFMRQLPKSYRLLTGHLNATVLIGFNKVGHNTFPNVIPMLTGHPVIYQDHQNYKEWPFIWKDFSNAGAVTMYAEDCPELNMLDYLDEGIDKQPTDHYLRTFWLAVGKSWLPNTSSRLCLGPRPKHDIHFSYLKSFLKTYQHQPKFLFSLLNEQTHNDINTVGILDNALTEFLNSCYNEGLLNRSVVFVLGDHGNRLDSYRSTELGKLEDYMPMVAVILPPGVNPEWRTNLRKNSNRLASTYDIYQTTVQVLKTLGGRPGLPGNLSLRAWKHFTQPSKGQSLFTDLPLNRTCVQAGIPEDYCICMKLNPLPTNGIEVLRVTNFAIRQFNIILHNFPLCQNLYLKSIEKAGWFSHNGYLKTQITFFTEPSNALFQAVVMQKNRQLELTNYERINKYANQSACLRKEDLEKNKFLKLICYCSGH